MKRIKKLTALFLAAAMTASLITGCGVKDGGSDSENDSTELGSESTETGNEAAPGGDEAAAGAAFEAVQLPDSEWQTDVTFPDWKETRSSNYAANNRIGFYGYKGQGRIYVTADDDCGGFSLYINETKLDTSGVKPGGTYTADISSAAVNGMNTLQVSDIGSGKVRVCIPYPKVIEGKPSDVGISEDALELVDAIITADVEHGFPGAQLAVIKDGRLIYSNAWGSVKAFDENGDPADGAPVTKDTIYDLASNTKMYSVNYAVQYLLTNGDIDLDTRIVDILGERFSADTIFIDYEGYDAVPLETNKEWKAKLTLRDLLCHQGGFPPGPHYYNDRYDHASQYYDSDKGNILYAGTAGDDATREETLELICKTPLMYEPGTDCVYSDLDYIILCFCVEEITGKRLDEYLKNIFWEPMGLLHITYNPLKNGFSKEDCAATELMGNTRDGALHYTGIRTETIQGEAHDPLAFYNLAGVSGHAGMFSNAEDLAKLAFVMLTGGYGEHRYFSREVIDLFTAPNSAGYPNYGLGWWREGDHRRDYYFGSTASTRAIGHQGFTGTLTYIDPDEDLVIVLLTNKINTKILEGDETLSRWRGNYYTTGKLGFAAEIVKMGMGDRKASKEAFRSLLADMAADAKKDLDEEGITDAEHPQMKAYEALLSVLEKYE